MRTLIALGACALIGALQVQAQDNKTKLDATDKAWVAMNVEKLDVQLGLPTFICGAVTAALVLLLGRQPPVPLWGVLQPGAEDRAGLAVELRRPEHDDRVAVRVAVLSGDPPHPPRSPPGSRRRVRRG